MLGFLLMAIQSHNGEQQKNKGFSEFYVPFLTDIKAKKKEMLRWKS